MLHFVRISVSTLHSNIGPTQCKMHTHTLYVLFLFTKDHGVKSWAGISAHFQPTRSMCKVRRSSTVRGFFIRLVLFLKCHVYYSDLRSTKRYIIWWVDKQIGRILWQIEIWYKKQLHCKPYAVFILTGTEFCDDVFEWFPAFVTCF